MTDSARHQQITRIFLESRELDPEEREAFLKDACAGDPELRDEVESLLKVEAQGPSLLRASVLHGRIRERFVAASASGEPAPLPSHLGPYEIVEVLGEGSQGIVYKAEQQAPRRFVALKVMKGGGFHGASEIRHFEREIQALAALQHPGIATIYDAGRTEDGLHFFAMELVTGLRIDEHARRRELTVRQRLELLSGVGDAMRHAHENGVIHRDLKPTNILVDEEGRPKILDFGLVRLIEADAHLASTSFSRASVVGSLGYMSPEQARGSADEIGPATDVYSLGVILYELLTGQRPYEIGDSLPDAVLTICRRPPLRPSAADRSLRGDLETILLKSLEKDPSERYPTVREMVDDIRLHLGGEPIRARRPGVGYIVGKRIRRHPVATAVTVIALLLAVVALGTALSQRQRALTEARLAAAHVHHRLDAEPTESALVMARGLSEKYPNLVESRLALARALFITARLLRNEAMKGNAIVVLQRGLEADHRQWPLRLLLAEIYEKTGNPESGHLRATVERDAPQTARAWYLRSMATFDSQRAVECATRAAELSPGNRVFRVRLAHTCERAGDLECALKSARSLAASGDVDWTGFVGHILSKQGMHREAITTYRAVQHIYPIISARHRAINHLCLDEYEEAIAAHTEAIERNPKRFYGWEHYRRATVFWMTGQLEAALADYAHFSQVVGYVSHADARTYLIRCDLARRHEASGRPGTATVVMGEARTELRAAQKRAESGSWLERILRALDGRLSAEELVASADSANVEQLCEAYYYAGEASLLNGNREQASHWYHRCVGTGLVFDPSDFVPNPMNEYHLARWRLAQLADAAGG